MPTRWPIAIILAIWDIGVWAMVIVLLIGMIGKPTEIESLWFLWLAMIGIAFLVGNLVTWQFFGKVRLIFRENYLKLFNTGTKYTRRKLIPYEKIYQVNFAKDKKTTFIEKFWGAAGGNIELRYFEGIRRFVQDLSTFNTKKIILEIQNKRALKKKG